MEDVSGRVALITGASRGIGAAAARILAEAGVAVGLMARSRDQVTELAHAVGAAGGRAVAIAGDVARFADMAGAVAVVEERLGPLDILVNNAGVIEPIVALAHSDPDAWGQAVDINLKGIYHGIRAVLPGMRARGGGVIVNLSSGAAQNPLEGWSQYCAAKAAAAMLTRCAHLENKGKGVRVIGLSPGTVATDMQRTIRKSGINPVSQIPFSDHIPPEWVARAIRWLCTAEAASHAGHDVSLRDPEIRRRLGLPE